MSYCSAHHTLSCTDCRKDAEHIAYWASVEDLEDFVPTDPAKILMTVGGCLVFIAGLVWILEYIEWTI